MTVRQLVDALRSVDQESEVLFRKMRLETVEAEFVMETDAKVALAILQASIRNG